MEKLKTNWWELNENFYESIMGNIKQLFENQSYRTEKNLSHLRLYGNRNLIGFGGSDYSDVDLWQEERLILNVCQSVVDAAHAKISSNRPRSLFLTEGGDWFRREQAKKLNQFVDGQFYHCKVYQLTRQNFKDAEIFGDGPCHIYTDWRYPENPKPKIERVLPEELWIDPVDAKNGNPRQIYRVKEIGREVLLNHPDFKKFKTQIHASGVIERNNNTNYDSNSLADPVTVIEAFHLPSGPNATDGKRVLCTDNVDLIIAPWERERFPFPRMQWSIPVLGYWAQGLVEQEKGIQIEINKILRKIQQHMDLASSFILANRSSKIIKSHLKNTPWSLLEYTGDAPTFATVASISPEYFMQLDRLYAKAFEIAGITQLFAQGKKPAGLDSGKALREYKDTESERFLAIGQAWEEFHLDIAECLIDEAKTINEYLKRNGKKEGYSVLCKNDEDDCLVRIKWEDVDLERDMYIMQQYPTSSFPKTPAAKLQTVKELAEVVPEIGGIYALKLLKYPDLKYVTDRLTASIDDIEKNISNMLYGKVENGNYDDLYNPPDAFTDLKLALQIAKGEYLRAKINGCPDERLELLRRYMTSTEALMRPPEQEMPDKVLPMVPEGMPGEMQPIPGPVGIGGNMNIEPIINVEAPSSPLLIPGR